MGLNRNDAASIKKAEDFVNGYNIKFNLIYINANFGILADFITNLETWKALGLHASIQIVKD